MTTLVFEWKCWGIFALLLSLFLLNGKKEILFASSVNGNSIDFQFDGQLSADIPPHLPYLSRIIPLPCLPVSVVVVVKIFAWRSHWPGKAWCDWSPHLFLSFENWKATGRKPLPLNCLNQRPVAATSHSCHSLPHATCAACNECGVRDTSCSNVDVRVRTLYIKEDNLNCLHNLLRDRHL